MRSLSTFVATLQVCALALAMQAACSAQDLLTVRIGLVAPTSGALAATGWANQRGAQFAIDEVNAQRLKIGDRRANFELLAEDDAGDPRQGTSVAQKLVDAKVNGVVGHQTSGSTLPASRLYSEAGIPQITPSSTAPKFTRQGFQTAFRLAPDDDAIASALAMYAVKELKLKRIAIVDDRTAYGHGISEIFSKGVSDAGSTIVSHDYVNDKAFDFTALLTTLKAKKPEAIFVGGMYSIAAPMLRQMKQLGITARMLGGDGICLEDLVKLSNGSAYDGQVICVEAGGPNKAKQDRLDTFRAAFRKKFGTDPEPVSMYSYDAVWVMVDSMRKAGSADPKLYLSALAKTQGYSGLSGSISFDAKGDLLHPSISFYTFRGGTREQVGAVQMR